MLNSWTWLRWLVTLAFGAACWYGLAMLCKSAAGDNGLWRVTSYCPCPKCCGKYGWGMTTASGHKIQPGDRFVAAPKNIPFGTRFIVPGYNDGNPVEVLDRGGAIKGRRLDVFFPTHKEALRWGVQYLEVKVRN